MDIPSCGYITYKNILILAKKSHYILLTEFDKLELKCIEKDHKTIINVEEYIESSQLVWILRIHGLEKNIVKTIENIEEIFNNFNKWIDSENQEISRIDPTVIKKVFKNYKKLPNGISLYYGKTILLISGNSKPLINKFKTNIHKFVLESRPKMIFFWAKIPDFFDALYNIEPLCNPNTGFQAIVSKYPLYMRNLLMSHILITADKPFIDQIWKSAKTILNKNIKQKNNICKKNKSMKNFKKQKINTNNYVNIKDLSKFLINNIQVDNMIDNYKYLDLQTNDKFIRRKKDISKNFRIFNPNFIQIPISKYNRNDNILSSSI